jgi:hypothetical protein
VAWNPEGGLPPGWDPEGWQPDVEPEPQPGPSKPSMRLVASARPIKFCSRGPQMTCDTTDVDITPQVVLRIGEGPRLLEIDFFNDCADFWVGNEDVAEGEKIRPRPANGFGAEVIEAGTTGADEPRWPKELNGEVQDGSARWKIIAAGGNAINVLSSPDAVVTPSAGLAVGGFEVVENRKVRATYAPTVAGTYEVMHSFVVNGETRKARQSVVVR